MLNYFNCEGSETADGKGQGMFEGRRKMAKGGGKGWMMLMEDVKWGRRQSLDTNSKSARVKVSVNSH